MASVDIPQFFAGMFDIGPEPDWERVARAVELVRSTGVRIVCTPAVARNGGMSVPFFVKSSEIDRRLGSGDPKPAIEAVSPFKLVGYAKVNPRTASNFALSALVKLTDENACEAPVRPRDLEPRKSAPAQAGDAFDGLIGLERQRDALKKVATLVAKHGRDAVECLHMAFVGPPGTGKSELAHRLLGYLDAAGVTSGNATFVKASAVDLVAPYLGHTPARTRSMVERAYGGMLFIDEAYSLLSAGDYGQEAIDTLVDMLECDRHRLVCVIAGYPDEVEKLFGRNPGLRDRFGLRMRFEDYTVPELADIFGLFAQARGFVLDPGAGTELERCLAAMRGQRDFANARSARRLFDRTIMESASRTDEKAIAPADIRAAFEQPDLGGAAPAARVGFAR